MNGLQFIYSILCLISIDVSIGFCIYLFWKFLDLRYFSTSEIEQLKTENKYLKEENRKINGTSTEFWSDDNER